jgi:SAM-dependent MidA family methyltransferase
MTQMSLLPRPNQAQLERNQALSAQIIAKIAQARGFLRFDDFMRAALYTPGLGYYSGPSEVFGAVGDFVTAPQISPLFAQCVAAQWRRWFAQMAADQAQVTEFGAGDGRFAGQILALLGDEVRSYNIIELSGHLQRRQAQTIATLAPQQVNKVRWLNQLPDSLEGIVFGNEVLDAMPVRLFELQFDQQCGISVLERGVGVQNQDSTPLCMATQPANPLFAASVIEKLKCAIGPENSLASHYVSGYKSELGEESTGWVNAIAQRLSHGVLHLIDYGFAAAEYYLPQRSGGTLMCHYRHRSHEDPLQWIGLQDITAHVDFTAVAQAAMQSGLDLLGYTTQARFLMHCGLIEYAAAAMQTQSDIKQTVALNHGLQKLVSEAEMGELFKVIAFGKGASFAAIDSRDRSNRL